MYLTTRGRLGEPNKVLRRAVIDFDRVTKSMRLAPVLAWAAAATATPPRGFLLVATNLPVQLLQKDADADWRRDELGCVRFFAVAGGVIFSHISRPPTNSS